VNPGLSSTFPYLSAIAQNFQEYKFKGLVFEFKSTSADALNSTNTALGQIMLVAQYRADASVPQNKPQFLNEMWAVDTKPSENICLPIECSPVENPLAIQYIRSQGLNPNQDQKLYDLCSVTLAGSGSQAVAVVGELWCTYEVELYKPVVSTSTNDFAGNAVHLTGSTPTTTSVFGSYTVRYNNLGLVFTNGTNGTITFPAGNIGSMYFIVYNVNAATTSIPAIVPTGGTIQPNYQNGAVTNFVVFGGNSSISFIFTPTTEASSSIAYSQTITGGGWSDVQVFQAPVNYY
jgi:hypothetical protein